MHKANFNNKVSNSSWETKRSQIRQNIFEYNQLHTNSWIFNNLGIRYVTDTSTFTNKAKINISFDGIIICRPNPSPHDTNVAIDIKNKLIIQIHSLKLYSFALVGGVTSWT